MQTNFFEHIAALDLQGELKLTIVKTKDNTLTVSLLLNNDSCGDEAKNLIPPLILKGTAEELNAGFFPNIQAPLQVTSQLFVNMESYMKQREAAQLQSQMEKDKAKKTEQQKSEKDKKYEGALKKAQELQAEGRFREAWVKLPDPSAFPEHADDIRKRKSELSAQFEQTSLFQS